MLNASFRIYLTANVIAYVVFAIQASVGSLGWSLVWLLFSFAITAPALVFLVVGFSVINTVRSGVVGSWLILLITAIFCSAVPLVVMSGYGDEWQQASTIWLCIGAGVGAIALQFIYLNKYFKKIHHESN